MTFVATIAMERWHRSKNCYLETSNYGGLDLSLWERERWDASSSTSKDIQHTEGVKGSGIGSRLLVAALLLSDLMDRTTNREPFKQPIQQITTFPVPCCIVHSVPC
jgi:hypothetical protein